MLIASYGKASALGVMLANFGVHALVFLVVVIIVAAIVAGIVYFVLAAIPPLARFAGPGAAIVFLLGLLIALAHFL